MGIFDPEPVVIQPNQGAPPGTPPGGEVMLVAYCGCVSLLVGLCFPVPCVCLCPCDKMAVYRAPDGTLYNMQGAATKPACMKM